MKLLLTKDLCRIINGYLASPSCVAIHKAFKETKHKNIFEFLINKKSKLIDNTELHDELYAGYNLTVTNDGYGWETPASLGWLYENFTIEKEEEYNKKCPLYLHTFINENIFTVCPEDLSDNGQWLSKYDGHITIYTECEGHKPCLNLEKYLVGYPDDYDAEKE